MVVAHKGGTVPDFTDRVSEDLDCFRLLSPDYCRLLSPDCFRLSSPNWSRFHRWTSCAITEEDEEHCCSGCLKSSILITETRRRRRRRGPGPGEDPHKHLKEFHVVCTSMKPTGVFE
ncbi:hypothetical protein MRB53_013737 [Persea americana]|uniref:Uncharacterized protein n=1 Tax=Persea americana TaxID=3435 RepID=A0ACC2K8X4_PERAE|nr:hypothetical protein MRB53_013737 [Persea americana]